MGPWAALGLGGHERGPLLSSRSGTWNRATHGRVMNDAATAIDTVEPTTWTLAQPRVEAVQVTDSNARAVAAWCGGYATDDLRWSTHMLCYLRPSDDPTTIEMADGSEMSLAGAMFYNHGDEPAPGSVMIDPFLARPGQWVLRRADGHFIMLPDDSFLGGYLRVEDDSEPLELTTVRESVIGRACTALRRFEAPHDIGRGGSPLTINSAERKRRRAHLDALIEVLDRDFAWGPGGRTSFAIEEELRRRTWPGAANPWKPNAEPWSI